MTNYPKYQYNTALNVLVFLLIPYYCADLDFADFVSACQICTCCNCVMCAVIKPRLAAVISHPNECIFLIYAFN